MSTQPQATVARLAQSTPVSFGPLAHYQKLVGETDLPLFTGVQTCKPGYQTPEHFHPYAEFLFIIEGTMEAWLVGQEPDRKTLGPGDMIALPPDTPHVFRNPGPGELRLLGIHANPQRIVQVLGGGAAGYVQGAAMPATGS